ncbi:MAG: S8 family serine peptidase [Flavobacteriales bacterium]
MRFLTSSIASVVALMSLAQTGPDLYWVQFTDKSNTPYSISTPEAFLSERAIARRQAQGIAIDELDLPVDPAYISAVLATGDVQLVNRSKWFNAITIRTMDAGALGAIGELPFVSQMRMGAERPGATPVVDKLRAPAYPFVERGGGEALYGPSFRQIEMLNGHLLHELEARGEGMLIGVLDSGFDRVNEIDGFTELRSREGIVAARDMVDHDGDVFNDHDHGRSVLSCMAANLPGLLVGTAPEADYVLVRTEEVAYERVVEEDNWVAGAEYCDSLGCDVLNTSLGYTTFDEGLGDHTYEDMNGATARISIAASIAASRGMIPVNSAGNSGSSAWYYIGAPADAADILAVGAVNSDAQVVPFSSRGPSSDGRVKPDVSAMGAGVTVLNGEPGGIAQVNGTSFSSPITAGLVACLWQLHPERTAQQIMHAVRQSASHWTTPNDSIGYGIPNFLQAHEFLAATVGVEERSGSALELYPVPFQTQLMLRSSEAAGQQVQVRVLDLSGRTVLSAPRRVGDAGVLQLDLAALSNGTYVVQVMGSAGTWTGRAVKQ